MQFLLTMTDDGQEMDADMYTAMGEFVAELSQAGVLIATGGLDAGSRLTTKGDEFTVTDGPFTETKETIVSFALVDLPSREEAVALTRRFHAILGGGESTMYQVFGPA
ncbi:YciI family protein [Pseudonocardia sp. CA-107938]|uniref:YciI family protein n=1 Tax=Pseudonocardia sp. CA-107938 TaxID=3240021 RepID=UPI003D8F1B1E